jgi:hypothetical protein
VSVTVRLESRSLSVFENKVLGITLRSEREEVTGERGKLHSNELHNLHFSPIIIKVIKSRIFLG